MATSTLIASISGIRGIFGAGLDAAVLVRYAGAYGTWCRRRATDLGLAPRIVIGRDARISGPVCAQIVTGTLRSVGCDVIDADLATTPTVAMAVLLEKAVGGIILSASHNPAEWNALKLLNEKGEFLSASEGNDVIRMADAGTMAPASIDQIGSYTQQDYLDAHIDHILELDFCRPPVIAACNFRIAVDGINSVGGLALPRLLVRLGVQKEHIFVIHGEPTGRFAHPAEPLPEHLVSTTEYVRETGADMGFVVDPDADRLALIDEKGQYVSEELTQVIAADFLWKKKKGPFVTNLSSSRAIDDVAARYGMAVYRSAVGEINVVKKMQEKEAILGGEGNGGVIVPELHYGRDALVGVVIVLQHLAEERSSLSALREKLPAYAMSKNKLPLDSANPDIVLALLAERHKDEDISTIDGVKINLPEGWVHLRKSNTEPILRIYTEGPTKTVAEQLAARYMTEIKQLTSSG